ncbi:hypothetical protein MPSEU_000090100 [Mayamaea pseudoterrestris]|nr:hypothetical protein MPSEU_000090100 [Mayamaea pseudoterrestris]
MDASVTEIHCRCDLLRSSLTLTIFPTELSTSPKFSTAATRVTATNRSKRSLPRDCLLAPRFEAERIYPCACSAIIKSCLQPARGESLARLTKISLPSVALQAAEAVKIKMTGLRGAFRRMPQLTLSSHFSLRQGSARIFSSQALASSSYASSTMDLVDHDYESWADGTGWASSSSRIRSTIPYGSEHDFDPSLTATTRNPIQYDFHTWNQLCDAVESSKYYKRMVAVEMDMVEASSSRQDYDKILFLIHHGEEESVQPQDSNAFIPQDSKLSDRGVGQALSLARRISAFCNSETRLLPELFILAPLRQVLQTAMLALPHYSPFYSFQHIPWLCHAAAATTTTHPNAAKRQEQLAGAAASSLVQNQLVAASGNDDKTEWYERTDAVLDMIRERDEQVIVVCTESNWLQSFGCLAQYQRSQQLFRNGEMRVIGINFV